METVLDLDTIDVELDDFFKKKEKSRCKDQFLNSLTEEALEECIIPEVNLEDFEANSEEEPREEGVESDKEEEEKYQFRYTTHDPKVKWNHVKPVQGERYETPAQLKVCLTNRSISKGYPIRYKKCDSVRLVAVYASNQEIFHCPYIVRASWMSTKRSFQIKHMVDEHTCVRNYRSAKLMDPTWIARQFLKELIRQPNMKCKEMQAIIQSKFHCNVSWSKCYRAKCRAVSLIDGKLCDHYEKIWDYGEELKRSNPGSTIDISVTENPDKTTTFHRIYTCFNAVKEGWKVGCRRVIGLDGCFLKGQCKGELLTAIGRDANNQVYPIAWAVVEIENKRNWMWFLELLFVDLDLQGGLDLCVISDQHKGLLEASKVVLPYVEHRQCARHVYANFRMGFSGLEFKNMFWSVAKSNIEGDFLLNMERIKEVNPDAYANLMARDPNSWCMAFFRGGLACEAVENGMTECFNAIILEARKKPLLTMLEEIRLYMMDRFYNLHQTAQKWVTNVCPAAIRKMKLFGEDVKFWYVYPSGAGAFEVINGLYSYGVNLEGLYCTCRLWALSGIPCVHAQACIIYTQQDPAAFISHWFGKDKFLASYGSNILPVNGSNMWQQMDITKPLPPIERRMPGRPTIKRRRHVSEHEDKYSQVSSKGRSVQCQNCQQRGHNKSTCKNLPVNPEPKPKKKMGRPRLNPELTHLTRRKRGPKRGGRGPTVTAHVESRADRVPNFTAPVESPFIPQTEPEFEFDFDAGDGMHDAGDGMHDGGDGMHDGGHVIYDDGDGIDVADQDLLIQQVNELRHSKYCNADIMQCLGISEAQLKEFDAITKGKQVVNAEEPESQPLPETQLFDVVVTQLFDIFCNLANTMA